MRRPPSSWRKELYTVPWTTQNTSHAIHVAKPHSFGALIGVSTGFLNNIIIEKMTNGQRVSAYWAYMWQRKLQYCFKCFKLMLNCRGIFSLFFILIFVVAQCPWLDSTLLWYQWHIANTRLWSHRPLFYFRCIVDYNRVADVLVDCTEVMIQCINRGSFTSLYSPHWILLAVQMQMKKNPKTLKCVQFLG